MKNKLLKKLQVGVLAIIMITAITMLMSKDQASYATDIDETQNNSETSTEWIYARKGNEDYTFTIGAKNKTANIKKETV